MIILLDENFPLRLYSRLRKDGFQSEHILLGQRGIQDSQIMARLMREELLFLTQDEDFVDAAPDCKASIIWSQVTQSTPIDKRVEIWMGAIQEFLSKKWKEKFFEVHDDGKLHPFEVIKTQS
jgi:predicted nuclease of predicted toxin-antitoxin system